MKSITTTELRTKSKELTKALKMGKSIDLIHHSKIIGKIISTDTPIKKIDLKEYLETLDRLAARLPDNSEEYEKIYRQRMMEKHGPLVRGR